MKKFIAIAAAFVSAVAFTACGYMDKAELKLKSYVQKLLDAFTEVAEGLDYVIDNFGELKLPVDGDGTTVDEWVGEELDPLFVRPEYLVSFEKGYVEENENGKVYCNLAKVGSIADIDKYVIMLRKAGYDEYNLSLTWTFYDAMVLFDTGKLIMAVEKDGIYAEIVGYEEGETVTAVITFANYDLISAATADEEEAPDVGTDTGDSSGSEDTDTGDSSDPSSGDSSSSGGSDSAE